MLGRLFSSTARTSARWLFGKANTSSTFVSRRAISMDQKESTSKLLMKIAPELLTMITGAFVTAFFWRKLANCYINTYYVERKYEKTEYDLEQMIPEATGIVKTKAGQEREPLERGIVHFRINLPTYWPKWFRSTDMEMNAFVGIGISPPLASTFEQVCDWLESRGIYAERSESGARRGLIEFAIQHMRQEVKIYVERNCRC